MARQIKPFKIPASALKPTRRRPKPGAFPKPENTDPKIPHFDTSGLLILGKPIGSIPEWHVSQALDILGLAYRYQVPVLGGRIIGGAVIDFRVYTVPIHTFVWVQGDYFHTRGNKEEEDAFLMARVNAIYHIPNVEVWEHEVLTIQMAILTLKAKLRL